MVIIGEHITALCKAKNWTEHNLGKEIEYFRAIIRPLWREGELSSFNKDLLRRIEDIEKLDTKQHLFFLTDKVTQYFKTKKAFSK